MTEEKNDGHGERRAAREAAATVDRSVVLSRGYGCVSVSWRNANGLNTDDLLRYLRDRLGEEPPRG